MNNSMFWLKLSISAGIAVLFALSIILWMQTPALFNDFQQAFCAH
ncbi:hypothetical protein [Acinetobacter sp. SWAC5]|nr:hypothetical protein [Acinetobacter sp. SWAC5]